MSSSRLFISGRELEMAVAFHRLDQYREENAQPLAADSIGRLPQYRQRLMHRLVVNSLPLAGGWCGRRMIQHAQRVLAVYPVTPTNSARICRRSRRSLLP